MAMSMPFFLAAFLAAGVADTTPPGSLKPDPEAGAGAAAAGAGAAAAGAAGAGAAAAGAGAAAAGAAAAAAATVAMSAWVEGHANYDLTARG